MKEWKRRRLEHEKNRMWTLWFAWRPVKTVADKWVWRQWIYRSVGNDYVDQEDWTWYFYADAFDVLRYI